VIAMQIPRYVVGAFLFGLVWASIVYTQGKITDLAQLSLMVLFFGIVGSALSWGLAWLLRWYRNRR
jgi:Kef-type K+ transport system membrane component KefB